MKKLQEKFSNHGMNYEVIERKFSPSLKKDVIICKVVCKDESVHYDICAVVERKEVHCFGKKYEPSETIPPTTLWGSLAWSYPNESMARQKYEDL